MFSFKREIILKRSLIFNSIYIVKLNLRHDKSSSYKEYRIVGAQCIVPILIKVAICHGMLNLKYSPSSSPSPIKGKEPFNSFINFFLASFPLGLYCAFNVATCMACRVLILL